MLLASRVRCAGGRTKTFFPEIPSKVNVLSGASSFTGTLMGMFEPTLTSAALRREVAAECATFVAVESKEAIVVREVVDRDGKGCSSPEKREQESRRVGIYAPVGLTSLA